MNNRVLSFSKNNCIATSQDLIPMHCVAMVCFCFLFCFFKITYVVSNSHWTNCVSNNAERLSSPVHFSLYIGVARGGAILPNPSLFYVKKNFPVEKFQYFDVWWADIEITVQKYRSRKTGALLARIDYNLCRPMLLPNMSISLCCKTLEINILPPRWYL